MAIEATYEPAAEPHHYDVCTCGHLRFAHMGAGTCLAKITKTAAKSSPGLWTVCACPAFNCDGRRWVPPDDRDSIELLRRGEVVIDHTADQAA